MSIIKLALVAGTLAIALGTSGCVAPTGEAGDGDEVTSTATAPLVGGAWVRGPGNGVVTGYGGGLGPLAVCRSPFDGGQHTGKLWQGRCNFGWGGGEQQSYDYMLLLDAGYRWVNPGQYQGYGPYTYWSVSLPTNAVDGGDAGNASNHVRLGVCQARRYEDNTWHPGKFFKNQCNIAWGGREIAVAPNVNGDVLVLVK